MLFSRFLKVLAVSSLSIALFAQASFAKDIEYKGSEIQVNVLPGEPTQISFPDIVQGGFKRNLSNLAVDRRESDLILFASKGLPETGEAIIVRLKNGRSYSLRVLPVNEIKDRDDVVRILDDRKSFASKVEDEKAYQQGQHGYAPPAAVTGLLREMVLATEFGKSKIPGYNPTERYNNEVVLNDGAVEAKIINIYVGSNNWGYVLEAHNKLDQTIQLNPATFRLDGTRAISISNWELKPRPMNIEQQIARKDKAYVYIVTKARKLQ